MFGQATASPALSAAVRRACADLRARRLKCALRRWSARVGSPSAASRNFWSRAARARDVRAVRSVVRAQLSWAAIEATSERSVGVGAPRMTQTPSPGFWSAARASSRRSRDSPPDAVLSLQGPSLVSGHHAPARLRHLSSATSTTGNGTRRKSHRPRRDSSRSERERMSPHPCAAT